MGEIVRLAVWTVAPPALLGVTFLYMVNYEPCGLGNEPCIWLSGIGFLFAALVIAVMTVFNAIRLLGAILAPRRDRGG